MLDLLSAVFHFRRYLQSHVCGAHRLQTEARITLSNGAVSGKRLVKIQTAKSLYAEGGPTVFLERHDGQSMGLSHAAILISRLFKLKRHFARQGNKSPLHPIVGVGLSKMDSVHD
jgi:hypothetical protein